MRSLRFAGVLALAVLVHVAATRIWPAFPGAFDLFLVVVVLHSLDGRTAAGLLGGAAAGLTADALGGGPFGLYGFADTILGYGSALLAQKVVVRRLSSVLVVMALAAAAQQAILIGMALVFVPGSALPTLPWALVRVGTTSILGVGAFELRKLLKARVQRRKGRSGKRLR